MPNITNKAAIIPDVQDFEKILTAKLSYEAKQHTPQRDVWNKLDQNTMGNCIQRQSS